MCGGAGRAGGWNLKVVGVQVKLSSSAPCVSLGRKINKKELGETPTFPDGSSENMAGIGRMHMETGLVDAVFSICSCCHNKIATDWGSVSDIYSSQFWRLDRHDQG